MKTQKYSYALIFLVSLFALGTGNADFQTLNALCQFESSNYGCSIQLEQNHFEKCIINKGSDLIANIWQDQQITDRNLIFYAEMNSSLRYPLLLKTYITAVDKVFVLVPSGNLLAHIKSTLVADNEKILSAYAETNLHLYWKFHNERHINDEFLLNVAYNFAFISNFTSYAKMEDRIKARLNLAINTLPSTLQHYFFKNEFCLLNMHYLEYIYKPDNIKLDAERSYILTWREQGKVGENGHWEQNSTESSYIPFKLKTSLKNIQFNMYPYYEESSTNPQNLVLSWVDGKAANWSLSFIDNQLIFESNGKLMCSTDLVLEEYRRYVQAVNSSESNAKCQWIAQQCPTY